MKKILLISYAFPPNSTSGIYRMMHFANNLAERENYQPFVLSVQPGFYGSDVHIDNSLLQEVHQDVKIFRTKCLHPRQWLVNRFGSWQDGSQNSSSTAPSNGNDKKSSKSSNSIPRQWKQNAWQHVKDMVTEGVLSFPDRSIGWLPFAAVKGLEIIRREKIDIILATGAPWTSFVIGSLLQRLSGVPLIMDYRDPWIGNPFHRDRRPGIFERLSGRLEKAIVKNANALILNTVRLKEDFILRYPDHADKYHALHNGYLAQDIERKHDSIPCSPPDDFIFIHAGSLYGFRSPEQFLRGFRLCLEKGVFGEKRAKVIFLAADDFTKKACQDILGSKSSEKHCIFSGRVAHQECIRQMACAQCLLLFQQNTRVQVPRKLFEYMALRKPILAITPDNGETARLVREHQSGIVVNDNAQGISEAITLLIEKYPAFCERLIKNPGYMQFEMVNLTKMLEDIIGNVLSK